MPNTERKELRERYPQLKVPATKPPQLQQEIQEGQSPKLPVQRAAIPEGERPAPGQPKTKTAELAMYMSLPNHQKEFATML